MTDLDGTLDFIEGDGEILEGLQEKKSLFREFLWLFFGVFCGGFFLRRN